MLSSSHDFDRSRELNGLPPMSRKRPADDSEPSASSVVDSSVPPSKGPWKSKPTVISTPENPRDVYNPYTRAGKGDLYHEPNGRPNNTNPTASRTVTGYNGSRLQKKPKLTATQPERKIRVSKFYDSSHGSIGLTNGASMANVRSAVPSFVTAPTTRSDSGNYSSSHNDQELRRNMNNFSSKMDVQSQVIDVDDQDFNGQDVETPVVSRSMTSDGSDDLNLFGIPTSSEAPPEIHRPSLAVGLGVDEPNALHPFRKRATSPPPVASSSRGIAEDGPSTARLHQKYGTRVTVPPSSPLSEAPPEDLVEEIEDADHFSDAAPVHRAPHTPNQRSSIMPHRQLGTLVKERIINFEEKMKSQATPFIPDLKSKGSIKSGMKGKGGVKTVQLAIEKPMSRQGRNSRRDRHATDSTNFVHGFTALPIEDCVWGKDNFRLERDALKPDYWLVWNEHESQLQLCKDPIERSRRAYKSVKLHHLKRHHLTYAFGTGKIFKIVLQPAPGVPDDLSSIGLMFKFMSKHPNILPDYNKMYEHLKGQAGEVDKVAEGGVETCLQVAMERSQAYRLESREKSSTDSPHGPPASASGMVKDMSTRPVRPRPAYGTQAVDDTFNQQGTRRRSSRLLPENPSRQESSVNLDEIILVYPPSGSGAVNITVGDLRRLEPSEFLNDTLIELGLKFWLNDLRAQQPELAEEIHVFSSFFYKKLNNKNSEGYKSVRKWTAKIDLFRKKYIIIPINENVHWYLAIIYHPEHVLDLPPPKPLPRTSKRTSNATVARRVYSPVSEAANESSEDRKPEGLASRSSSLELLASPSSARDEDDDAEVEQVVASTRSFSLEDQEMDKELVYPAEQEQDKLLEIGHKMEIEDDSMELGYVEGGGPSHPPTDVETVPDSEEESFTSDSEEVDQLCDDDEQPTSTGALESGSITPAPPHTDMPDQASEEVGASLMEVEEPGQRVSDFAREKDETSPSFGRLSAWSMASSAGAETNGTPSTDAGGPPPMDTDFMENEEASMDFDKFCDDPKEHLPTPPIVVDNYAEPLVRETRRQSSSAVPSAFFYRTQPKRPARTYGTRNPSTIDIPPERSQYIEGNDAEPDILAGPGMPERPRTWIFTLDSLGSKHPGALRHLNDYLRAEAKDKKGNDNPSDAMIKSALVPTQPNFCDCGLYLLHFARTFMSDPEKYKNAICASKRAMAESRSSLWLGDQVATMREEMKGRILAESEEWKKLRVEKELEKKGVGEGTEQTVTLESTDDEIEVSEVRPRGAGSSPNKRGRKTAAKPSVGQTRASRLRG